MSGDDDDAINRPGGAQSPAGDAEPLPAEVSSPDPSAIGAPNDGAAKLPSAAELKKMQDAEAMKKKLSAQKRREKLSPAARLEAKRKRALRRKRMIALANTRAKKAEAKRLRKLEEQWKQKWYKEFEGKREKWEKEHKHNEHVTVDLTGNKPVSVSISKPEAKLTPATDEEKKKAEEADAETAKADESASGGSGGSGGSDAAEPAKDESSDGNAEDEARFRQFHSAHLVDVATDGSQRVSHQRHRRIAHTRMPEGMGDLMTEPVTHASTQAHAQWMGDFTALLQLDAAYGGHGTTEPVDAMDDGLDAALSAHAAMPGAGAAGPNKLLRLVLQHRKRSLMHAKQQTPRYMRPSEAQSFFQAYERIGFGGFSGFDGFSGFGTPNPPPPPAGAPGTFAEVGSFAGAAGGAGAAAAAAAGAGVGAAAGAATVAGMYGGVGAREDDADLPKGALDPDADHAVVQDQQHPKYTTPFVGDEVWEFNIDTKQWKFIPKAIRLGNAFPQPRWLHSAVVIDGKMVIFGGVNPDSVILGDVWIFDPNSHEWMNAKIEGVPILPREGHTATAVGNSMIVIGGISYAYSPFDDVWTYLSGENKWVMNKPKGPKPAPRWMHTAVLHASKSGARSIFIFGGITHQYVPLNDLWRLNVESMTWEHPQTKGHAPFPRMLHAAVIFEDDMFVHAGGANNLLHEDLWKITLTDDAMAWEEQLPAGASPFARMGHTLTGVSPPMNPTPSTDPRPAWHPPDNSVPSAKVQKPFPIRPRKEYSTNRYFYCFGGARNNW